MAGTKVSDKEMREFVKVCNTTLKDDGSYNIRKIAQKLGISRGTVSNRISKILNGEYIGISLGETLSLEDAEEIQISKLKDEIRKLRKEISDQTKNNLDVEALEVLIGKIAKADPDPPKWTLSTPSVVKQRKETPVTIWSDWHYGEVVNFDEVNGVNEYNSDIAEDRIKTLLEGTIDLCKNHSTKQYDGMVINLLGDFISGGLHPELLRTDDYGRIPASIRMIDLLTESLEIMGKEFGSLYVPCTSGNHGRNTTRPEYKGYVHQNFDYLIYEMIMRRLEDKGVKNIKLVNPVSNQVHYKIYNTRFLAMHGDMLGARGGDGIIGSIGPIMRGEFKTRRQSGAMKQDYDYLLMGHYHQELWLPNAIVAGSIKGFDEYVKNDLRAMPTTPSQPLFFVHPERGITSRWNVQVEKPSEIIKSNEWISYKAA